MNSVTARRLYFRYVCLRKGAQMGYLYQEDRAPCTDDDARAYENRAKFQAPPFWELPLDWLSPIYVFDVRPPSE